MKFAKDVKIRLIVSIIALATLMFLPVIAVAQQAGAVLYLPLSEGSGDKAGDSSGKGNDGKLFGSPEWVAGRNGKGLYLDGKEDYIEVPGSVITAEGTIEFWFKPDWDGSDDEDYRLFDASSASIYFFISKGANHADINPQDFGFYFEDASDADWQDIEFDPTDVIKAGEWYHIAATWKFGGGSAFLYINGEQAATSANVLGAFPALDPNPRFGLEGIPYVASKNGAAGVMDEIAIYDRQLTVDEIIMDMEQLGFAVKPSGKAASTWGNIKLAY
jgi:hypothetical protein